MAANALYYLPVIYRFCADADRDGKYYPVGIGKKGEEAILDNLPGLFDLEYPMYLLGIQRLKTSRFGSGNTGNADTLCIGATIDVNLLLAVLPFTPDN
jgi:hypothetical protein